MFGPLNARLEHGHVLTEVASGFCGLGVSAINATVGGRSPAVRMIVHIDGCPIQQGRCGSSCGGNGSRRLGASRCADGPLPSVCRTITESFGEREGLLWRRGLAEARRLSWNPLSGFVDGTDSLGANTGVIWVRNERGRRASDGRRIGHGVPSNR